MFQRFYTIAANTFVETLRQPIYGVLLMATAMFLILNVSLAAFTIDDDDKLLLDLGLSTLLMSGLFLSVFSAAGILSREIDNKTVLTVISKPVSRPVFLFGKFAGLIAALGLAFYLSTLVFILAVRHGVMDHSTDPYDGPVLVFGIGSVVVSFVVTAFRNFFYNKDFPTGLMALLTPLLTVAVFAVGFFDAEWERAPWGENFVGGQVILAAYLVWLMVAIMAAVAVAASTRLGQLPTLVICTVVMGVGIIADSAFGQYESTSLLAKIAYGFIPNMGPFWVIDGLHAEMVQTTVTFDYVGLVTAYATLLMVGIMGVAMAIFQRRELG